MLVLVLNPGGNSLKAEIVRCNSQQLHAFEGTKLISVSIEGIGKQAHLSILDGKKTIDTEPIAARDYGEAAASLLTWLGNKASVPRLNEIDCVGLRVVHGGLTLTAPAEITPDVEQTIRELEKLAPLHNKNSLELLGPVRRNLGNAPLYGVFDTAFHRTMPERSALYAIPPQIAERHAIRRYGFHGISHRYMLERYAHLAGRSPSECTLVSMHLESGCSVTAIRNGKSVDNTMGLTPLEGLMMGTRSGDIDPSIVPFLVEQEGLSLDEVMVMLNKQAGLLGVSGESLDTRVLMKKYESDLRVKLAMDMFAYRVLKAVGGYFAALGGADALIFGGGIAENNIFLRKYLGDQLRWCGLEIDPAANESLVDTEGLLSTPDSRIQAWVIPVEEGLQIAHEGCHALCA